MISPTIMPGEPHLAGRYALLERDDAFVGVGRDRDVCHIAASSNVIRVRLVVRLRQVLVAGGRADRRGSHWSCQYPLEAFRGDDLGPIP